MKSKITCVMNVEELLVLRMTNLLRRNAIQIFNNSSSMEFMNLIILIYVLYDTTPR